MNLEHFKVLISVVQVVLIPLLMAGLTYLNRIRSSVDTARTELQAQIASTREELRRDLHEITAEVRKTNGRLIEVETWRRDHDSRDTERFGDVGEELRELRRAVERRNAAAS